MYEMVCNRSYIAHAMGVLRRYISKQGKEHSTTIKKKIEVFVWNY
jgi:hypothetical protein